MGTEDQISNNEPLMHQANYTQYLDFLKANRIRLHEDLIGFLGLDKDNPYELNLYRDYLSNEYKEMLPEEGTPNDSDGYTQF